MPLWLILLIPLAQLPEPPPRFERLDNGLRVVVVEDHTLPLVSVQIWYRVGSAQDPLDKPGLAAVCRAILEHRDDAALRLRAAGVRFESRTLRDACYFSSLLPPNFVEYVLDVEAERMRPDALSAEQVERGLAAAAWQYADQPDHEDIRHLLAAMFPDHPYQHPPGFVTDSLKGLSAAAANEFLKRWFVTGNATLVVVGGVSTVRVLEQVRERFGKLPPAKPPRQTEPQRLEAKTIRLRLAGKPGGAALHVAWRTPPLGHFENAAIDVLMHRLLNPIDGSLLKRLRAAGYPQSQVVWRRWAARHGGLLWLQLAFAPKGPGSPASGGSLPEIEQVLDSWMREIEAALAEAETRVSDELVHNRARGLATRDVRQRRVALPDRAKALAEYELVAGDLLLAEYSVPRIRQVAVPEVQAAATLLNGSRRVVIEYLPDATGAAADPRPAGRLPQAHRPVEPRTLDAVELLALVRGHAAGAPQPRTPAQHPHVRCTTAAGRVPVLTCRLPGARSATIAMIERYASREHDAIWCYPTPRYWPPDTSSVEARMIDYAAYHGVVRHWATQHLNRGRRCGRAATADPQRALAMLEWFTRLHVEQQRSWPVPDQPPPGYEVFAVGAAEPEDVADCLEYAVPASELLSGDKPAASRPTPAPALTLTWTPDEEPKAFVSVVLSIAQAAPEAPMTALEARVLSTLLGRMAHGVETAAVDAIGLWRSWSVSPTAVVGRATVDAGDVEAVIRRLYARLDAIRTKNIPVAEMATALRLAQTEQLVRLDGPIGVVEAISWDRENPWVVNSDVTPEKLGRRLADVIGHMIVGVYIIGGDEAAFERLRELERAWNKAVGAAAAGPEE